MRFLTVTVSAAGLFLAGCATSSTAPASKPPETKGQTSGSTRTVKLAKGMPVAEVLASLGEPSEKKPMKTASGGGEIWIYRRTFEEFAGSASTGTEAVTEFGPFSPTGVRASVVTQRPVFKDQYRKVEETTMILIIAGQVVEWDRTRDEGQAHVRQ